MAGLRGLVTTFLWLRWRMLAGALTAQRRSGWGLLSRWLSAAGTLFLWVSSLGGALALSVVAIFGVAALADGGSPRAIALIAVRVLFGLVIGGFLVFPAVRGLHTGAGGRIRLRLLPISDRTLVGLEVVGGLADPWLMMVAPVPFVLGLGLALRIGAAGWAALAAGAALFACLVALSAVASFGIELLLRNRRRAEMLALVLSLGLMAISMIPALLDGEGEPRDSKSAEQAGERVDPAAAGGSGGSEALREVSVPPVWTLVVPSEAYAHALSSAAEGRTGATWRAFAVLGVEALFLFGLASPLWVRLTTGAAESAGRRGAAAEASIPSVPGVAPVVTAVAWVQVRTALRTLPGRMALISPVVMVVFLTVLIVGEGGPTIGDGPGGLETAGALLALAGCGMGLMALQPITINQLAVDGSGLQLLFQAPLDDRTLVAGKAFGLGVLSAMTMLPATVVVTVLRPGLLPLWPAFVLVGASVACLTAPVNAALSSAFPKAVDPGRFGKESQPHQLAALIALLAAALAFAPPVLLGAGVFAWTRSALAVTLAEILWLALAIAGCRLGLRFAATLLTGRRESVYLALSEGG